MHQLIEDLLLLARSDEGAMQLRHDDVDIDDLLLAEASRLRGIGSVHTVTHIEAYRPCGTGPGGPQSSRQRGAPRVGHRHA